MTSAERSRMLTTDAKLRSRTWHEQKTAAGRCHWCGDPATGFYCWKCSIEVSRRKAFKRFFVVLIPERKCVECRNPHNGNGLSCRKCKKQKVLNAHTKAMRSLESRASRAAMDGLQPLPLPIEYTDPGGAVEK